MSSDSEMYSGSRSHRGACLCAYVRMCVCACACTPCSLGYLGLSCTPFLCPHPIYAHIRLYPFCHNPRYMPPSTIHQYVHLYHMNLCLSSFLYSPFHATYARLIPWAAIADVFPFTVRGVPVLKRPQRKNPHFRADRAPRHLHVCRHGNEEKTQIQRR